METCPMAVVLSADYQLRRVITAGLGELGCKTYDVGSQAEALAYAAKTPIDVAVIDGARDAVGRDTIRKLLTDQPQLHILYLLDTGDGETGRGSGVAADASLRKPFELGDLCDIVSTWLAYRSTLQKVTDLSIH
jgi:DNA-binding response OmpR family regulator